MNFVDNLTLEEIDQRIAKTTVEAAIEIGYYLKQIRDRKLYEQAGCRDVFEYAKKHYGYDKSVASRHMSRNDRFSVGGNSPELAPEYLGYGKSQLQEMISMTGEQLEQAKPEMTVREMKNLKKKPEKAQKESEIPDQKVVATSQQNEENSCPPDIPGCRRQEWGLSATQQEQGKKECRECWNHWKQLHPEKQSEPEGRKQKLSAYGLPVLEYPPDSLLTTQGCGEYGTVSYNCFNCHMSSCQIRQEDCYCVDAPMGNPFPCRTLLLMEQETARQAAGDRCQFVNHDLTDHRAGDHSAVPCCKDCDNPCEFRCERAAGKLPEEAVVDGDFREVEEQPKADRYEEVLDLTDVELLRRLTKDAAHTLKLMLEEFTEKDWRVRKQKLVIQALSGYIRSLEEAEEEDPEEPVQPVLPVLRNNEQRKAWLRSYKDWGLWYRDENIGADYYKFDFENGARLIAEVYQVPKTKYCGAYESCYLHLVGGPDPVKNGPVDKWTRHERYSRYPNSETELAEFLKEVQRGKK